MSSIMSTTLATGELPNARLATDPSNPSSTRARPAATHDGAWTVVGIVVALAIPLLLTLSTVQDPGELVIRSANPTPYGYTWSLGLWIVPLCVLVVWLHRSPGFHLPRVAFWRTLGPLCGLGLLLDIAFGHTFFRFPNAKATLEVFIWSMDLEAWSWRRNLPIEEIAFYFFGIAFTLILYIWSDLHWFGLYSSRARAKLPPRGAKVRLDPRAVVLGAVLIGCAFAYKKLVSSVPDGFPGYFAFLVAFALVPACSVLGAVRSRINWRAFSFTMLVMFTVSTWWEATVAFPYRWWTYRDEMMIGVFIKAWNGLPLEEPLLWLLVSFTTVLTFEANLLDLLGKRSTAELRFAAGGHPQTGGSHGPAST
jgi:hypothetical protein